MSSTTLATLSLRVQPENTENNSLDQPDIQASPKVGYRKVDIDLVKQQETKSISDAKRQPDRITNGDVPWTNGIGKGHETNGVEALKSETPGSKIESEIKGSATNPQTRDDRFQRLPKPQQEILLLHGPGQRYRLEKAHDIPELKSDQEILVQVGKDFSNLKQY